MNRKDQLKYLDQDLLSHLRESVVYLYYNLDSLKKTFGRDIRIGDKVTYDDYNGLISRYIKIKDIYPNEYGEGMVYVLEGYIKSKRRNCWITFLVYKIEKRFCYVEFTVKHNYFYLLNNRHIYSIGYKRNILFPLTKNKVWDLFDLVSKENFMS